MNGILKDSFQVIPIFPVGRAGSLFVQSIFDDNKDFFTFPTFNPIYSSIPKTIKTDKKSIKFFCLEFWNKNQDIFDLEKGYISDSDLSNNNYNRENIKDIKKIKIDKNFFHLKFSEFLKNLSLKQIQRKNIFFIICKILNLKIFGRSEFKYLIYNGHNQEDVKKLINECNIKLSICLTRNPISSWSSWKKILKNRHLFFRFGKLSKFFLIEYIYGYVDIYNFLKKNIFKKDYIIVDLIEFHRNHKIILNNILNKLEVDFSNNFLKSTFYGIPWFGNAADKKKLKGFDINKKDSVDGVSEDEIYLIIKFIINKFPSLNYKSSKDINQKISFNFKKEFFFYFLQKNFFNLKKFRKKKYNFKRLFRNLINYREFVINHKKKFSIILQEMN